MSSGPNQTWEQRNLWQKSKEQPNRPINFQSICPFSPDDQKEMVISWWPLSKLLETRDKVQFFQPEAFLSKPTDYELELGAVHTETGKDSSSFAQFTLCNRAPSSLVKERGRIWKRGRDVKRRCFSRGISTKIQIEIPRKTPEAPTELITHCPPIS